MPKYSFVHSQKGVGQNRQKGLRLHKPVTNSWRPSNTLYFLHHKSSRLRPYLKSLFNYLIYVYGIFYGIIFGIFQKKQIDWKSFLFTPWLTYRTQESFLVRLNFLENISQLKITKYHQRNIKVYIFNYSFKNKYELSVKSP